MKHIALLVLSLAAPHAAAATIVDQTSSDTAVLGAHVTSDIGGNGAPGFSESECTVLDASTMDCTAAFEARFQLPAIHPVRIPRLSNLFFCRLVVVQTVTRKAALDAASGIGFYYRGYFNPDGDLRVVPKSKLHYFEDATLKNGEPAVIHWFGGLANCNAGSGTSSQSWRYEFKAFAQFLADDTEYRNWETARDNHYVSLFEGHWLRDWELLQTQR